MKSLVESVVDNICHSEIKKSKIHGNGLFATSNLKKNTILGILDGQIVEWKKEFYEPFEWNALEKNVILVRPIRTKYSYINHSRNPNLALFKYPLRIITILDVHVNEELTIDYRKEPLPEDYLLGHGATYL
jgi:SET domain-containing protein